MTASTALRDLRFVMLQIGSVNAESYRTHDLRRGHAWDLQNSGAALYEILAAGDWKSPAFLSYIDRHKLEDDVAMQAHLAESDDE